MAIETVESWRELDQAISDAGWARHPGQPRATLVFRGLARAAYSNVSGLARLSGDYPALERHLIRNFRKYAHKAAPGPTTWDWLALGQHHGLPTRLLDWTFSPLIALHFATASWPDDDAVLWAVDVLAAHRALPPVLRAAAEAEGSMVFTTELLARHAEDLRALDALTEDEPFVVFFEPPTLDERIANQAAVLSAISDPRCQLDEWLAGHPGTWRAWRLPARLKAEVRDRLDQAQLTERLFMPGLDGLAAYLKRYYSPQSTAEGAGAQHEGSMA
jgi:hypothetical protein